MTRQRSLRIKLRILNASVLFLAVLAVLTLLAGSAIAENPVPFTNQPLVPDATAPGGAKFTLTVNGTGFVAGSVVNWNGSPRATTFVSSAQLKATILASDITTTSTAAVTVVSPGPGGGVSNPQFFSIAVAEASVSFLPPATYDTGGENPSSVAIADVDGDGKLDVIVANQSGQMNGAGSVAVLLGNGHGTFQAPVDYDAGMILASSLIVTDVNGDGKLDIVVVGGCSTFQECSTDGVVGVLLGKGDGTFKPAVTYSSGGVTAASVAAADVNGDGRLDLLVSNQCADFSCANGSVGVLLGNGDGTFQPAVAYSSGGYLAGGVAVADVSGDGKLDVVVTNFCPTRTPCNNYSYVDGNVGVLLGNGDGTFNAVVVYDAGGTSTMSVAIADVSGDGKLDLLTANCGLDSCGPARPGGTVGVLLGNGDGTFHPAVSYGAANGPISIAIADMNGDGKQDAVVANWGTSENPPTNNGAGGVLLGNGDGTFQPVQTYLSGGNEATSVAVADLTGAGRPDIAGRGHALDHCRVSGFSHL